jgi:MFS transporter, DHA2 family, multidrug resistance protein
MYIRRMTTDRLRAGRREWTGLAVLLLPILLISIDTSVLFFAMPFISEDLRPSGPQQLWILDIYGFMLAGLLVTMGVLGDRIGRRRLLMLGAAAFGTASVITAYSTSAWMLIGGRALLGVAGATLMPSTLALIRNMFHDQKQRSTAIAIWTGGLSGGIALGPILGGFMLDHFWWGSVFLINLPCMVALLILGPILLPEFRDPRPGRFDMISAALSLGTVLPVIYGIKTMAAYGFGLLPTIYVVAGLAVGAIFVRRQRTQEHPLIDLRLFRHRAFSASVTVNVLTAFAMMGFVLFTSQYLQLVQGLSPFAAALWCLPATLATVLAVTVAAVLAKSVRPAFVLGGGLTLSAIGFALLSQVEVHSSLAFLLTGAALMTGGMGAAMTQTADMILATAPAERAGAASAVSETGNELGGALGIAILGCVGTAVYRHDMAHSIPAGTPAVAAHAARATLGGAVEAARQLPERTGFALLDAGRQAFTHGLDVTAVVAAVVMATAGLLATLLLRQVRIQPTAEQAAAAPANDSLPVS